MVRQPKNLSKPLVTLFTLTQLLFGINYGFFATLRNKRLRALANLVSILLFIFTIPGILHRFGQDNIFLQVSRSTNSIYYVLAFILLRFSKYNLYEFLKDLVDIDEKCNLLVKYSHVGLTVLIYSAVWFCANFVHYLYVFIYYMPKCWLSTYTLYSKYMTYHLTNNVFPVVNMLVFYQIYVRIKAIKTAFEQNKIEIKDVIIVCKFVDDSFAKIRVVQDPMIAIGFVADFIRCVISMWSQLSFMKEPVPLFYEIHFYTNVLYFLLQMILPAVFAELIAVMNDELKMLIHERLLLEQDEIIAKDLLRLLRYVEARPLLRKAWRLVPVDLRLSTTLLSMSVTYLIVLLQITHVF